MATDIVDDQGRTVPRGQIGELVLRRPNIGLPQGLWRAPERYLDSYWRTIPGEPVVGEWVTTPSCLPCE